MKTGHWVLVAVSLIGLLGLSFYMYNGLFDSFEQRALRRVKSVCKGEQELFLFGANWLPQGRESELKISHRDFLKMHDINGFTFSFSTKVNKDLFRLYTSDGLVPTAFVLIESPSEQFYYPIYKGPQGRVWILDSWMMNDLKSVYFR